MSKSLPSVRFFGLPTLSSGYGNATINLAHSFSNSSVDTSFIFPKKSCNLFKKELKDYKKNCDIDFYIHTPPFNRHKSNKYKIGYFYWETDSLPYAWQRDIIKSLNEIWAPCDLVKKACIRAGFKGPIEIVPTPYFFRSEQQEDLAIPSPVSDKFLLSNDVFKFYSIFQWHKRKGYQELLKAYFEEFSSYDNVILVLKVNPLSGSEGSADKIKFDIITIKNSVNKEKPPKVFLMTDFLPNSEISKLHTSCDCFVLPHRGEGWGMPIHDAMVHGNHIITTKYGGITEYLTEKSANIIPHKLNPVSGMEWSPLYNSSQLWAYPDQLLLGNIMRNVYNNKSKYDLKRKNGRKIGKSFDIADCSKRIETILSKGRFAKNR